MGLFNRLRRSKPADDFPEPSIPFYARDLLMDRFYGLQEKIKQSGPLDVRLRYCEQSLEILPEVIKKWRDEFDEEPIPPLIVCRDYAPEWYGRLGKWDDAFRVIRFCVDCGAYTAEEGRDALNLLIQRKAASDAALSFISDHPGWKQADIYRMLPNVDRDALKWFTRNSLLIRKEPNGKTNLLFLI